MLFVIFLLRSLSLRDHKLLIAREKTHARAEKKNITGFLALQDILSGNNKP